MLLMEPNQTQYDLRFRVFGIPVRVHPMFWLIGLLLGWSLRNLAMPNEKPIPLANLGIWVGCMFLSILLHELGHVFMGMVFGSRGHIVLYGFGGLAIPDRRLSYWWQRVLVSFAGPLAQFVLLALILLGLAVATSRSFFVAFLKYFVWLFGPDLDLSTNFVAHLVDRPLPDWVLLAIIFLILQNLFWGLLNLLPIWPLDGGQMTRDVFMRAMPHRGYRISLGISFIVGGLLALNAIMSHFGRGLPFLPGGGVWMAIMFGLLAFQSFQLLQERPRSDPFDPWQGQRRPWER